MTKETESQLQAAAQSDLQQLKALALRAWPGKWAVGETYTDMFDDGPGGPETVVRDEVGEAGIAVCLDFGANNPTMREANAAFIAASGPAVVLDLIARIEKLRADHAEAFQLAMSWQRTAEKKDRDWNEARMAHENDRAAARLAAPAAIPEGLKEALAIARNTHGTIHADSTPGYYEAIGKVFGFVENALTTAPAQPAMPAPQQAAPSDAQREAARDAVAKALDGIYYCGRVWEAWDVGTMGEDDFTPAAEVDDVLDEITGAAIDAIYPPAMPALLDHAHAEPTAWISVAGQLPEVSIPVLVHRSGWDRAFVAAYFDGDEDGNDPHWQDDDGEELHEAPEVWQPLPLFGGEVSQGAAPTAVDVRAAALEEAAAAAEDTDVATRKWAMQRYDDGSQTRADIATAIRGLKRAAQPNIQEAGND